MQVGFLNQFNTAIVAGVYMGAFGFCDDLLLLAPTIDGMQIMLVVCQRFAAKNNLQFSTDPNPTKSKNKFISKASPFGTGCQEASPG